MTSDVEIQYKVIHKDTCSFDFFLLLKAICIKDKLMGAAYKSTYKSAAKNSMVLTCAKYMLQYLSIHFVPCLVV